MIKHIFCGLAVIVLASAFCGFFCGFSFADGLNGNAPFGASPVFVYPQGSVQQLYPNQIPSQILNSIKAVSPSEQPVQAEPGSGTPPDLVHKKEHRQVEKPESAPSAFERYVNGKILDKELPTVSKATQQAPGADHATPPPADIKQFGYDLFRNAPSTFAPVEDIPVGPDYLLGPGDEVRISLWGKLNTEFSAQVDRDGNVTLPQIGVLHLSGLTFAETKDFLAKEFSRYYLPTEVKMNVSMGSLRSIRVFVVGKASRPGSYTVSSLSTLVNALFLAGGPSKVGTMRDIQVKRNGQVVTHFDFYDFLLNGDKTKDVKLMPEDVIFIPPAGPLAAVYGDVRVPAIYELDGDVTLAGLIEMAGGLNDIAFRGRLQVDRITEDGRAVTFESNLEDSKARNLLVRSGDLFKVFPVVQDNRMVRLTGAVMRPGEYGAGKGLTVKGLIEMAGGLRFYAYKKTAELTRVTPTDEGPKTVKIRIDLEKALAGDAQNDIPLQDNDYLFVRAVPEWNLYRTVDISGEVKFPGTYTITKGETVSSLIERAGGFTEKAYLKGAVFTRESVRELQQKKLDESIDRLEQEMLSSSAQSIESALSPQEAAQQEAATRQRRALIAKMRSAKALGRITIRLAGLDKFKGSSSDLTLDEGDRLDIPERPSQVQVIGSVFNPSAFVYTPDGTVSSYVKKAGGVTSRADDDEMYVLKIDGSAISKQQGGFFGVRWDSADNEWTAGGFNSVRLDPGDTVVVPEKLEKIQWLKETKDMTQILYQIAVTAGVLIVAF